MEDEKCLHVILSRALPGAARQGRCVLCGEESLRSSQRPFAITQGDMNFVVFDSGHSQM